MDWDFAWAVLRLVVLLPLVLVLAYMAVKFGVGRLVYSSHPGTPGMQVLDRLPLGAKSSLIVVKVADRYFLLAHHEKTTGLIQELEDYPDFQRRSSTMSGLENGVAKLWMRISGWRKDGEGN